jgi:WD40-like Beta Propeller Repeat
MVAVSFAPSCEVPSCSRSRLGACRYPPPRRPTSSLSAARICAPPRMTAQQVLASRPTAPLAGPTRARASHVPASESPTREVSADVRRIPPFRDGAPDATQFDVAPSSAGLRSVGPPPAPPRRHREPPRGRPTPTTRVSPTTRSSGAAIVLFATATARPLRDLTSATGDSPPVFSPDGRRVAFERRGSVYDVRAAGGKPRRLRRAREPSWSR